MDHLFKVSGFRFQLKRIKENLVPDDSGFVQDKRVIPHSQPPWRTLVTVNPDTIVFGYTGKFGLNTLRVDGDFYESGKKKLRIQKYCIRVDGALEYLARWLNSSWQMPQPITLSVVTDSFQSTQLASALIVSRLLTRCPLCLRT